MLLGYYDPDGRLIYAGRAGSGINDAELERLWRRMQPLATDNVPLDKPPPRGSRFGSPLVLSRVHWVRVRPTAIIGTASANARNRNFADSPLEEARFDPSVALWLGAFTRSKKSISGPVRVGGA